MEFLKLPFISDYNEKSINLLPAALHVLKKFFWYILPTIYVSFCNKNTNRLEVIWYQNLFFFCCWVFWKSPCFQQTYRQKCRHGLVDLELFKDLEYIYTLYMYTHLPLVVEGIQKLCGTHIIYMYKTFFFHNFPHGSL